jgi:hypothetical protein
MVSILKTRNKIPNKCLKFLNIGNNKYRRQIIYQFNLQSQRSVQKNRYENKRKKIKRISNLLSIVCSCLFKRGAKEGQKRGKISKNLKIMKGVCYE